jgi:preprotein translocase subunit SecE
VARNRKRRNDRRPRQTGDGPSARPGLATASGDRRDETPDPIEHATPDVELAEAQLAVGRPELSEAVPADDDAFDDAEASDADGPLDDGELVGDAEGSGGGGNGRGARRGPGAGGSGGGGELATTSGPRGVGRLVQFVQGSWRELQRVQWPDRRQVMQATGVVIGFVIVAGAFLGVADLIATKLVNLIIK